MITIRQDYIGSLKRDAVTLLVPMALMFAAILWFFRKDWALSRLAHVLVSYHTLIPRAPYERDVRSCVNANGTYRLCPIDPIAMSCHYHIPFCVLTR
jgi:hypothetical protein